ncbi:MAG: pyruvate, phosphate dikinase [Firmicutes bacterium]|nr:pyruvate, phosphate dikinase [Bacillota bacterium]
MTKFVYSFNEGSRDMKQLLGTKGANLAEMTGIGLPVPFGFTITTQVCNRYYEENGNIGSDIEEAIFEKIEELQQVTGKVFGDAGNPLLVSVRSGAAATMPGMMDTVLNLGLNDNTAEGLAALTGSRRFALDSYRRFLAMFGDVVLSIPKSEFEKVFDGRKEAKNASFDVDLDETDLEYIIGGYKEIIRNFTGSEFPQDPKVQLMEAVKAVFRSWNSDRAVLYRKLQKIPADVGTAVNVQAMVFGNMGEKSGTGVAFTRDPSTGEKKLYGEFLVNAQGEDVVAGVRTPLNIDKMAEAFPENYKGLVRIAELLEKHYKDVQDMEFTIENGKLYMLQTRNGKRTAQAAIKTAVDMAEEGLIDKATAITRVAPEQIDQILHPTFDAMALKKIRPVAKGLPASPGAACGKIYFTAEDAVAAAESGETVILVRDETSPEDLAGMVAACGILTARGGMTSHAAVVARGMGKCCVAGCSSISVSAGARTLATAWGRTFRQGDYISIDGNTGFVYEGILTTVMPVVSDNFNKLMSWADELRELKVRANADSAADARLALEFGADGIGLCRTERMLYNEKRMVTLKRLILSEDEEEKSAALADMKAFQKQDLKELFKVMGERPVTVRLLDLLLSKVLPYSRETNPLLGHRGCRLAITDPEITVMQTEAIIGAALEVKGETGVEIVPEIMIPLISSAAELSVVKKTVRETADRLIEQSDISMDYLIGTMIETPRAALTADEIAAVSDFISFGTNDLTQMTYGISHDDGGRLVSEYVRREIMPVDPFASLDMAGVGKLIKMACDLGRQSRARIKTGLCGEHGGDPATIEFCHNLDMGYVSCSPYRIPAARLAAAQAAVRSQGQD